MPSGPKDLLLWVQLPLACWKRKADSWVPLANEATVYFWSSWLQVIWRGYASFLLYCVVCLENQQAMISHCFLALAACMINWENVSGVFDVLFRGRFLNAFDSVSNLGRASWFLEWYLDTQRAQFSLNWTLSHSWLMHFKVPWGGKNKIQKKIGFLCKRNVLKAAQWTVTQTTSVGSALHSAFCWEVWDGVRFLIRYLCMCVCLYVHRIYKQRHVNTGSFFSLTWYLIPTCIQNI